MNPLTTISSAERRLRIPIVRTQQVSHWFGEGTACKQVHAIFDRSLVGCGK